MCGIGFAVKYYETKKMPLDTIKTLFTKMEDRGTDASGYYFERTHNKQLIQRMIKAPLSASELWDEIHDDKGKSQAKKKFSQRYQLKGTESFIMLHARAKTTGTEYDNNNNMPIFNDDYVLIHNGLIHSSRRDDYKYMGEVDSEEILANISKLGLEEGIKNSYGSMSIVLRERNSKYMYIYRRRNPMDIMYLPGEGILYGSSKWEYLRLPTNTFTPEKILFDKNVFRCISLPEHKLYRLNLTKPEMIEVAHIEEHKPTGTTFYGGRK